MPCGFPLDFLFSFHCHPDQDTAITEDGKLEVMTPVAPFLYYQYRSYYIYKY